MVQTIKTQRLIAGILLSAVLAACGPFAPQALQAGSGLSTPPAGTAAPSGLAPQAEAQPGNLASLRVAYVKDGNIWLWSQVGQNQALTSAGQVIDVDLSDDGQVVAFVRQVGFRMGIWAVNADGSHERELVRPEALDAIEIQNRMAGALAVIPHRIAWAPGTHLLAYNTRQFFDGPGLVLSDDLRQVNADTGEDLSLLPAGQGGEFYFAPDGGQIAVVTPTQISLVNASGGGRRQVLEYEEVITFSEFRYYARPQWSPDSAFLRVAIPPSLTEEPLSTIPPTVLWHIPADGSPPAPLGSVGAAGTFGAGTLFSPDLSRVIYTVQAGDPDLNLVELHTAGADGSGDSLFHRAPFLMFQGWGGDSQHFVFTVGERDEEWQVGQAGGGFASLLGEPAQVMNVRWVDAQRFLSLVKGREAWELRLSSLGAAPATLAALSGEPTAHDYDFDL